nr:putative ribonuclease H-like domain-containing protein [Tanacetum cinerariifolium]
MDGVEVDLSNISTTYLVSTTLNTRIHKDHSLDNVIGDMQSCVQTRRMTVTTDKQVFISAMDEEKTHADLHTCLFSCFLSKEEPKRITNALKDPAWMDVKSAFLHGKIKEKVYVCQPPGFEDLDYPDKVYKVEKSLDGLHQAPRAWYETLAKYLLDNGFHRGKIDQTLFIKRQKEDILLVHVDDIIFGSTKKELCTEFEELMHHKFQMSSMGEHTFFLELQVKHKSDGIFISQDKYVDEIWRNFKYADVKLASTPMDKEKDLLKDLDGDDVDVYLYRSMIGSLMHLTSSRPNIMFVCKKQTVVATSTTKAKYVTAASCCGQMYDGLERDITTASSLEAEQGSGNISKTQTKATPFGQVLQELAQKVVPGATLP